MINGQRVLGLITARGGSKGLPGKNILPVCGKPLIAWSIEAAQQSKYIDHILLSSDDIDIIKVAKKNGCDAPFVRPAELAMDETTSIEVVLHALAQMPGYDVLVLLQPTSPLRSANDIDGALEKMVAQKADSCVSIVKLDKSPYWCYHLSEDDHIQPLLDPELAKCRRQELPLVYMLNGALFIVRVDWVLKNKCLIDKSTIGYTMPKRRSIDVDTIKDVKLIEYYLKQNKDLSYGS